jgi:hypothetical protein
MRGAQLWFLHHKREAGSRLERVPELIRFVTDHDGDAFRRERGRGVEDVVDHRDAGDAVKNFRARGFHARAFSGREHGDVNVGHLV